MAASDAARSLFALQGVSEGLARSLLDDLVSGDARLRWIGSAVGIARPERDPLLEEADYVVFDLETTGLGRGARICEIGAVRISALEQTATFETLVDPRAELPAAITALTGIRQADLRGAPSAAVAVRRFMAFAGDAVLVAHNARFDRSFLDRDLDRLTGKRLAAPVLDTLALARTLLAGRVARTGLASLSYFFGTHGAAVPPRAAGRRGDRRDPPRPDRACPGTRRAHPLRSVRAGAPRKRKVYDKRSLAHGAPQRPGVYRFCAGPQVLYVGRARDLRARLRSYFRSERQRPSVEVALSAVDRIEWDVLGSELEAGLEELRLIRELRPPANARQSRPDRYVYLRQRGDGIVVSRTPGEIGPIRSRRQAELAARALAGASRSGAGQPARPRRPPPQTAREARATCPTACATRTRHGCATASQALERLVRHLRRLQQLRSLELCILAPAVEAWDAARVLPLGRARPGGADGAARSAARRSSWRRALPPRARARSSWTRNRWTSSCSSARSCGDRRPSSRCARSLRARPGARPDPVLRFPHTGPRYGCPRAKGDSSGAAPGRVRRRATCSGRRPAADRDLRPERRHPGDDASANPLLQADQADGRDRRSADGLVAGHRSGTRAHPSSIRRIRPTRRTTGRIPTARYRSRSRTG